MFKEKFEKFQREQEQFVRSRGGREFEGRRLLQDNMGISAADTKGADTGPARVAVCLPLRERCIDVERAVLEIDLRVGFLVVETGGDHSVLERENSFD